MAKRRNDIVYLIPEGQTRENHDYHYTTVKRKGQKEKMKFKKYNPVSRKHENFVEVKRPSHN